MNISLKHIALFVLMATTSCMKEQDVEHQVPDNRHFLMGFTAFPYALSLEALAETYNNVLKDGDLFLSHLDNGVPWDQALDGSALPLAITEVIEKAKAAKDEGAKLFLTTTPTSTERNSLALIWNDSGEHQELNERWEGKKFNDANVKTAYLNYCSRLIDATSPDYFAFAIEINNSFQINSDQYIEFKELANFVYTQLKSKYPNLPVMLTLQSDSFENSKSDLMLISKELLAFSDYVAMSTYPYLSSEDLKRNADPALFSDEWLAEFKNLAPDKPFAVSETTFIAEDFELEHLGIRAKGKESWQDEYLKKLLQHADALEAEFVCWFIYRDYDSIYEAIPSDALRIWKDTGLIDEDGNERSSYATWLKWFNLPLK